MVSSFALNFGLYISFRTIERLGKIRKQLLKEKGCNCKGNNSEMFASFCIGGKS